MARILHKYLHRVFRERDKPTAAYKSTAAGGIGKRREAVSVRMSAGQAEEQRTGRDAAGIVVDGMNLLLQLARQKHLGNRAVRDRKNRVVLEYGGKLHGFKSFCVAGLAYEQTSFRATVWYEADIYAQGNQAPSVISVKYCLFRHIKDGDLMCLAKYSKSISFFLSRQSLLKSAILGKAQQSRNFSCRFCEDAVR